MRADIQPCNSITTLPIDCVGTIANNITEDTDDKNPHLLSLSAWSRISHSMMAQLAPWLNPQEHGYRLINQASDHVYRSISTMKLVARFAPFFPDNVLENEIRVSCGLSTSQEVNELLMIARAGETMHPSAQEAIALHLKEKGILARANEADFTSEQYQLGANVVAEILGLCGINIYEFERSKEKILLAASLLNDGLKALSMLTKPLRIYGFFRIAKSLDNQYSAPIAQQCLAHSKSFISNEWDVEFMASKYGKHYTEGLTTFMRLPMPDSYLIEESVASLLDSYLTTRSATDPHWKTLPDNVLDLSLGLYLSLRLKNKPGNLLQQLTAKGIFTKEELAIMDAGEWSDKTNQAKARLEFQRLLQNAAALQAAAQQAAHQQDLRH